MKNKYLLLLIPFSTVLFGQTEAEKLKISSFSNKEANAILLQELKKEDQVRKIRLANYLQTSRNKAVISDNAFGKTEIMDVLPNGELILAKTDNAGASITARANKLYSGGSLGINIQGQGMTPAVWDGGTISDSHQEFMVSGASKVSVMDGGTSDDHATHVGGTIAAQGIVSTLKGIAFNANLKSYQWTDDLTEMLNEASSGLLVSNHSYAFGSLSSLWFYGAYDSRARQIDNMCYNNPYYLPVVSAGNSRNETTTPGSTQIANKFGYDMIFGQGNAKNVMTVAAVNQVSTYVDPSSVVMSSFSSYGPSDDGRIKPDISMKGVNVRSTTGTTNTSNAIYSGTSMASPGVTGVVTLLQQYHNQLYSTYMKAATVKGVILHTADESGNYDGPDYEFGWGLINAESAAKTIRDKNLNTNGSLIEELNLTSGTTNTKVITSTSSLPLKISISWTDPNYPSNNNGTTDPATKYLVNDLDIKVTSSTGTIYYPWKMPGMSAPWDPATNNSTNDVDNFERVDIPNPVGSYTISVTNKGTLTNGNQNYTLIVTGGNIIKLGVKDLEKNPDLIDVYPNPAKDILHITNYQKLQQKAIILDYAGRTINTQDITNGTINIQKLSKGNYMLMLKDQSSKSINIKFTKE